MDSTRSFTAVLMLLFAGTVTDPAAGAEPLPELDTRLVSVALFKNGLARCVRKGAVPAKPGEYVVDALPPSAHGSVWVECPDGVRIESLVSDESPAQRPVTSMRELLWSGVGSEVSVIIDGEETHGRILDFLSAPTDRLVAAPHRRTYYRPQPSQRETITILGDDGSVTAVPVASVESVRFAEPPKRTFGAPAPRLRMSFAAVRSNSEFELTYVTKGLTWAPSYSIQLGQAGRANLSASAVIVNEAEDLEAARVDLVTGVPNLRFADVISPLAMEQSLADFLRTLTTEPDSRRFGSAASQAGTYYLAGSGPNLPAYGVGSSASPQEDLHFRSLDDVSLSRGSSGWYPLFEESVPCEHLYQWKIGGPERPDRAQYGRGRETDDEDEGVWHAVKLTNPTDAPWTTAPAEIVSAGMLRGQGMLSYTPPGASSVVRITRAIDVHTQAAEHEQSRGQPAGPFRVIPVTLAGEAAVTNRLATSITLEVTKELEGVLLEASPEPDLVKKAEGLARANPSLVLTWSLVLAPGERQVIRYSYVHELRR